MKLNKGTFFVAVLAVLAIGSARAQQWPQSTIKVVVPYSAGGLTDTLARTLADGLSKSLKSTVIVDNKPGASSIIGTDFVAKSPPDGYTLLVGAGPMATAEFLYPKLPYNPSVDLLPVALVARGGLLLVASPGFVPASTVSGLVSYLKQRPGEVAGASFGSGTLSHMALAQFEQDAGVSINHIAYRGSAPALQDVVGGQVQIMFDNVATALPLVASGRLKALAYTGATRTPQLPNVPTLRELGYAKADTYNFYGIYAPRGTPPPVVNRLNAEILKIFASPTLVQRYGSLGAELSPSAPEDLARILADERARWGGLIKARKITSD